MAMQTIPGTSDAVAEAVRAGLLSPRKSLPAWLLYDGEGSRLFERITQLPEYYLTRTERSILARHADAMVRTALSRGPSPLHVAELGAGSARKTELLLWSLQSQQGRGTFLAVDLAPGPLEEARQRLNQTLPQLEIRTVVAAHEGALPALRRLRPRVMVLFLGSSIGNYEDADASALLRSVAQATRPGGLLLLGTDLRKDPELLVEAYDDEEGVTAAFDLNVLRRLNRELGARFELEDFRHLAEWNDERSRVEMYLESLVDQRVPIPRLGVEVSLRAGERIHTESSVKYDLPHVDRVLRAAGWERLKTWQDDRGWYGLHLAELR